MSHAIYKSKGKAAEYSPWACNFYVGCSNDCDYCFNKKGPMSKLWSTTPTLKKGFADESEALDVFIKEAAANLTELRKHGLLFSFTTDPLLTSTNQLTLKACNIAVSLGIPVQILTKSLQFMDNPEWIAANGNPTFRNFVSIGFTITDCDEMEPCATANQVRYYALEELSFIGVQTFVSIEPFVKGHGTNLMQLINNIKDSCKLAKIGLMSRCKDYDRDELVKLVDFCKNLDGDIRFYLKDSLVDYLGIDRATLPDRFVGADYRLTPIKS